MQSPQLPPSASNSQALKNPAPKAPADEVEEKAPAHLENIAIDDAQTRKTKANAATIQANLEVSLGAKDKPMALVYKAALEGINEALEPTMGPNAAEKIRDSGIDVSPEATAERIVSITTGFFSLYQEQHQDMSLEEQIDSFLELIGGGVDQGFGEARDILDGLGVLEGELEADIDRTYTLVQEGFESFRDRVLGISEDVTAEQTVVESSSQLNIS